MKKLFLLIFIFISKIAFAQKDTIGLRIPFSDGTVVYERVFEAPGISKSELYNNAQLWLINRYKSANNIQVEDTVMSRIVGRGTERMLFKGALGIEMSFQNRLFVQIDCKENRYRCRIYNMRLNCPKSDTNDEIDTSPEDMVNILTNKEGTLTSGFNKNQARRMLESLNLTINNTMASLNKTMTDKDDF